ncbi:uncharacterized protein LOC131957415 [Physella acuta]|uniref:uncharacterized protein LOC131957415 n=1 Tax=Physella acuta TaxID=109671 RepID=UPI0027DB9627|nr:uncharacterized protein LOC131957415 [Physella acuta]
MFVSNAKVRIIGLGGKSRKRRPQRRRLAVKEFLKMPCLLPTIATVVLGLMAVSAGAGMAIKGYIPQTSTNVTLDSAEAVIKVCSFLGPVVMATGLFAMIVACVFYCEILDKYAILVPDKHAALYDKDELFEVIVKEMKKSYAQTLVTAYSKAAERSFLLDNPSSSGELLPEPIFPCKPSEPLTLEQQIDIECEGYTPSPPIPHKKYSVIQARIQRLRSEDNWLKTSSLPNIRRSASIKRAGRVGGKIVDSRTLSYDYTMDEARLRRKSMMLRSLVQWNSESSDMLTGKQRRFSSVKALPSQRRDSWGAVSQSGYGSFPLTRLIQRRGTFACGDMRTRRMKFLLLLEASESQDALPDTASIDGRATVAGIRRNSFIPYTTCDRFIADEEKKTLRDSRRPSINPFSFTNRFGSAGPKPGTRRHSFFPIRRDDKILVGDVNEHRRHSFNPIGVNNTLKPEYAAKMENRRSSFNPDGTLDKSGDRRGSHVPQQSSRFLQVPGFEVDLTERRPSIDVASQSGEPEEPAVSQSVFQNDRQVERRHSFNPPVRMSAAGEPNLKVPKITISVEPPSRFLTVPSQDYYLEERERRHSFNTTSTKPASSTASSTANSSKTGEKAIPQRISFRLDDTAAQPGSKPKGKAGPEPVRPSSFKQEMIVFKPLRRPDSRSVSPASNISCCGSERLGSEQSTSSSLATSRTASISSERSLKTAMTGSPSTVVAADGVLSYGTFDGHPEAGVDGGPGRESASEAPQDSFKQRSSSFRDMRGRGRLRHHVVQTDSPGSTSSGPATLTPSTILDANAAIHRSRSASSLGAVSLLSPQSLYSYARVPKPTSPLISRHKTPSDQRPL